MLSILAAEFAIIWPNLSELQMSYVLGGQDRPTAEELKTWLGNLERICRKVGWNDLANQSQRLLARAVADHEDKAMEALAQDLREAFEEKTHQTYLAIIEQSDTQLYLDAASFLCGKSLHAELSVSEEEFNLAGRALALGLSTASVSHAMRSVEASLHTLARTLNLSFQGGIQLQDWVNLTEKLQSEIESLEKKTRSPQKMSQLKNFSELLLPADCFRLVWRNHVAHAREKYEYDEAKKALGHVAEYLKKLSESL